MKCAMNLEQVIKNAVFEGIIVIDEAGTILKYNENAVQLIELMGKQIQCSEIKDIFPFIDIKKVLNSNIAGNIEKILINDEIFEFEIIPVGQKDIKIILICFRNITWIGREVDNIKQHLYCVIIWMK